MTPTTGDESREESLMSENPIRTSRDEAFARYLAIASGEGDFDELDDLMAPSFVGHMGERTRDLAQLKRDMTAYRASADGIRFHIEQQFGDGDFLPRESRPRRSGARMARGSWRAVSTSAAGQSQRLPKSGPCGKRSIHPSPTVQLTRDIPARRLINLSSNDADLPR
jgi:hypothetical protein